AGIGQRPDGATLDRHLGDGMELAATLALRLKRLEAMRQAADGLVNRNRLGRDIFVRGAPENIPDRQQSAYAASLYDLLTAYAALR
ncbi:hypothetical protein ACC699_38960, partial [Rhizobium ruizarguesonis]